jgi:hypothetical protein
MAQQGTPYGTPVPHDTLDHSIQQSQPFRSPIPTGNPPGHVFHNFAEQQNSAYSSSPIPWGGLLTGSQHVTSPMVAGPGIKRMSAESTDANQPVAQRPRMGGAFDSQGFAYSLPQAHFPSQSHIQFGAAPLLDPHDVLHRQQEMAGSLHVIQTQNTAIQKLSDRLDDVLVKIEGLGARVTTLEVLNELQKPSKPVGNKKPKRTAEFNARSPLYACDTETEHG